MGVAGVYRRHADELLAEAGRDANIPFILSGASMATGPTLTWRDLDTIRKRWTGPLVVKGLVHPDDISRAAAAGADVRLFFDGGIRRGSDIVVAKALGADRCFVGRAAIYGVAAGGLRGAKRALALLQSDMEYTMAMIGVRTVSGITRDHVCWTHKNCGAGGGI